MGKYIGCAGSGKDRFVIKKLHIDRSFPGTGDLYGAVLLGSLIQGNALSAAADNAAEVVSLAIHSAEVAGVRLAGHPEDPRRAGHPLRRLVRAAAAPPVPAARVLREGAA